MPLNEGDYRVVYSEAVRAEISAHLATMLQAGWEKHDLAALVQSMDDRLKHEPFNFGEPLYSLHVIKIMVAVGFVRPLAVRFGVHDQSKSVFVRKVILMTTERPD